MTDIVDSGTRSRMMSGIRGRDTSPELIVRRYLHSKGFRFRLHVRNLPGRPDLVFPKYRAAVFVHGCFWHRHDGCRLAYSPKSRREFWETKFRMNVERDQRTRAQIRKLGWRVFIVWECGLRKTGVRESGLESVAEWLLSDWPSGEFPASPVR